MSDDIAELERRITEALERIAQGVDSGRARAAAPPPQRPEPADGATADEVRALREALEAERAAKDKLKERVNAVRQRQETGVTQLERRIARMTEQIDVQGLELQRLKKANAQLVAANRALMEGGDPEGAARRAETAELEALRAERRAEMAEMEAILSALAPLVPEEAAHG